MSLQSLDGFVLNVIDSRGCFHSVCCSYKILPDISLFRVCNLLTTFCEGSWRLRWFLVWNLCLICLLSPGLNG